MSMGSERSGACHSTNQQAAHVPGVWGSKPLQLGQYSFTMYADRFIHHDYVRLLLVLSDCRAMRTPSPDGECDSPDI